MGITFEAQKEKFEDDEVAHEDKVKDLNDELVELFKKETDGETLTPDEKERQKSVMDELEKENEDWNNAKKLHEHKQDNLRNQLIAQEDDPKDETCTPEIAKIIEEMDVIHKMIQTVWLTCENNFSFSVDFLNFLNFCNFLN